MPLNKEQITSDLNDVEVALTHALVYPYKAKLGDTDYNNAHKELQDAINKVKRIKRALQGTHNIRAPWSN